MEMTSRPPYLQIERNPLPSTFRWKGIPYRLSSDGKESPAAYLQMEAGDDWQLLHGQLFGRFLIRVTADTLDLGTTPCSGRTKR